MVMASAHATSSPRDHVADANPDLARKKQRFTDEEKGSAADELIVIEAFDPEDVGTNIANAIEIEDDTSTIMTPYSETFKIYRGQNSSFEQLGQLQKDLNQNCYIEPKVFVDLARSISDHVRETIHESNEWRQHYLVDECDFFMRLALVAIALMEGGELFEPGTDLDSPIMRQAFEWFYEGLEAISHRIIPFLAEATKATLSRRDSAQVSSGPQLLGALYYIVVAERVLVEETPTYFHLRRYDRRNRLELTISQNRGRFFQDNMLSALASITRTLSGGMRDIKDSWTVQLNALTLFRIGITLFHAVDMIPCEEIKKVMEVVNSSILPAICEKHPRALPEGFHGQIVEFGTQMISVYIELDGDVSAAAFYECFVKSDKDAVIPHTTTNESISDSLLRLCGGDFNVLARLLKISWAMQAANDFIRSEIMDIRNIGVTLLKSQLVTLYKHAQKSGEGFEHPVVQYAVRFLRQNEITGYIFGPESRAGLIRHSDDIICFLAATSTYTDAETDTIWRACSTSVEADFVKASFSVLRHLIQFLDFQRLIYIARKYSTTAAEKLDIDAIEILEHLFKELETKELRQKGSSDTLALAFTSVEILKEANSSEQGPVKDRLRHLCLTEIKRFTYPHITLEEKAEIYKHCIPEIRDGTEHATTAVEVLTLFLSVRIQSAEAEHILSLLPVSTAMDEFCSFIQRRKQQPFVQSSIPGAILRLSCIARLMALAPAKSVEGTQTRLFDYAFGDSALCTEARNRAWMKLHELATADNIPSAASSLWQGYMQDHVPHLRADLATPKLVEFICASLKASLGREGVDADLTKLLGLALWTTLVRFVTTSTNHSVINVAISGIIDMLFKYPCVAGISSAVVVPCQCEFVRLHIENLSEDYEELLQAGGEAKPQKFVQGIFLLNAVLDQSRETASIYSMAVEPEDLVLDDSKEGNDFIQFAAHIHGPATEPKRISVRARRDTKVSELIAKLPQETGTSENRIIAGGKEVSLVPDRTLSDAGVEESGVAMICPKYTFSVNLDQVLTSPGPVEQQILNQYDTLDSFLDGPDSIAQKVYAFLRNVRQSSQARFKVSSPSATAPGLFPPDKMWRSIFSLTVLQRHLADYARLGVADNHFIDRTIRLLMSVVLDDTRPFQPFFILELANTLLKFFEERVHNEDSTEIDDLDPRFVSRMISLIFEGLNLPLESGNLPNTAQVRPSAIIHTYKALLAACREVSWLWKLFVQEPNIVKLHELLLLDQDGALCSSIAQYITGFCHDTTASREIANFYWQAIAPSISKALRRGPSSEVYFTLAVEVLHTDQWTQLDEAKVRSLIGTLTSEVWSYRHTEDIGLPIPDIAMAGLLRLLGVAITVLKSFKKPLEMQGLSSRLFRQLLFPPLNDPDRHPLVTTESRNHTYDLVRWCFEPKVDYDSAISIACEAIHTSSRELGASYPGHAEWTRPPWQAAGLINLGMTCYMNSLLQQLFANLQFRKFILEQPVTEAQHREPLAQVRILFAYMQDHSQPHADTIRLAEALNVQVGNQEDVHTFYTTLLSRLEDNIHHNNDKVALNKFFTGKSVTQVKGECGHVSSRTEQFTELSVTVKNKGSLAESLDEFVQGEPLEGANKYMCMTCDSHDGGRLVNAMRRTCLEDVPDNLTFCLKRFTYETMVEGENKVNDRFEFPSTIDISLYKRNYLEAPDSARTPDEFELVGVIVHQGSLQFGHYWSYIRMPGATDVASSVWMCLEDSRFFRCTGGVQEVQEQCFGGPKLPNGNERPDSAYVLFYQRKSYIMEANAINVVPKPLQSLCHVLPRVEVPDTLAQNIASDNRWRQHIESLFHNQFGFFITWLIGRSPSVLEALSPEPDDATDSFPIDPLDRQGRSHEIETKLGDLIANYTMRILLADPCAEARLDAFMTSLITLVEANTSISSQILKHFCSTDGFGFANTVRNDSAKVRARIFEGLWKCMSLLREHEPQSFKKALWMVIESHSSIIGPTLDASFGRWDEYFAFATRFAQLGFTETRMVLDRDYLKWTIETLQIRYDPDNRKSRMPLFNWMRNNNVDLSALFNFVFNLLDRHIDLSESANDFAYTTHQRTSTPQGWCLWKEEIEQLFKRKIVGQHNLWLLLLSGARQCSRPTDRWEAYAPGKLLGLLVSDKVDVVILRFIETSMLAHYDYEENELSPLIAFTLHYCLNRPDQNCKTMMTAFSRNLLLWEGSEKEALSFYENAYLHAPSAVVDSITIWAQDFAFRRKPVFRQSTSTFLQDHLFGLFPLSQNPTLDAARIRTTRTIAAQFIEVATSGYNHEHSRARYESVITVLEDATAYLTKLNDAVAQYREEGIRIGHEILVEHDESRAALTGITQLLDHIKHWEIETTLPTRSIDVRRSVEEESEGSEASYVEVDDMSSEHDAV